VRRRHALGARVRVPPARERPLVAERVLTVEHHEDGAFSFGARRHVRSRSPRDQARRVERSQVDERARGHETLFAFARHGPHCNVRPVRRSFHALSFIAALVPIASIASAQDAQSDAGAPNPTTTVTQPAPTQTQPAPTQTAPMITAPPVTPKPTVSEQEPLRLGRMLELEADRARARRYGSSVLQMVLGGGAVALSAAVLTVSVDPSVQTLFDILAVAGMVSGGLTIIDGVISLFASSPMERAFDRYAPIAIDNSLTPGERVHRGEALLESMANAERSLRMTAGVENIVLGGLEAALAIVFAADNDLWAGVQNADVERAFFGVAFGVAAAGAIGEAIAKMVWERGPAEVAWEHWHASHEVVTVQTSKVRIVPTLGPTHGGAAAGFAIHF